MLELSPQDRMEQLRQGLDHEDAQAVSAALQDIPEEDLAECLTELDSAELAGLVQVLGDERIADLVEQLDPSDAARVLHRLSRADAADVLEEMAPDDATDVIEEFDLAEAQAILVEMDADEAAELRTLMGYPSDSAAGVMTPAFVAVRPDLTADEALQAIRQLALVAETIYYVYVTDADQHLLGVLSLRDLVLSRPDTPVRDLMLTHVARIEATADREEAARLLTERGLLALPVIDDAGRILGIITADDVAEILERETTEDIERLGGSEPLDVPYLRASIPLVARKRVGWLLILFVAQAITASVLQYYSETLAAVVSLSFFIPLLIGIGGNVGSQTTTTIIRAMAVGEVRFRDVFRVLRKEIGVATVIAVAMALSGFLAATVVGVEPEVRGVVAVTAMCVVLWAQTVAAILPLALRKVGIDPAVVSAPFISTLVDGTGLIIYFTIAGWLLGL